MNKLININKYMKSNLLINKFFKQSLKNLNSRKSFYKYGKITYCYSDLKYC